MWLIPLHSAKELLHPTLRNFMLYMAILSIALFIVVTATLYREHWNVPVVLPMDGWVGLFVATASIGFVAVAIAGLVLSLYILGVWLLSLILGIVKWVGHRKAEGSHEARLEKRQTQVKSLKPIGNALLLSIALASFIALLIKRRRTKQETTHHTRAELKHNDAQNE